MSMTMKELAVLAGVSQSTVSLVLNGKTTGRIAKEKQEKVLRLAKAHNFRPNLAAKGLRLQKQYTVGVIMSTPVNPFYSDMVSLLQAKLAKMGYMTLFSFWEHQDNMEEAFQSVFQHNVDGVIAWGYHECLNSEQLPTVVYDLKNPGFDAVLIDFESYAKQLTDYLLSLGHHKIAYVGPQKDSRLSALVKHLNSQGISIPPEWMFDAKGIPEHGIAAMTQLLNSAERPTAMVCQNDAIASGVLFAASQGKIKVPKDISVIGFDNLNTSAYFLPPLTTFDAHSDRIADQLIELLMERIQGAGLPEQTRIIQPELILRNSCGTARNI